METTCSFSASDIAYIERNFIELHSRPMHGPAPSYILGDGRQFYPRDYFDMEMDEARFKQRLHAEMLVQGVAMDIEETWQSYMSGLYGVCLHSATPENIVRKAALLESIQALISVPDESNSEWVGALKRAVDALDVLERPFSPHYDRFRFGRPPTRDTYIRDVRQRFSQIA